MSVRAPIPGLSEGERTLSADTSRYVCRVRRLGPGEVFVGFDPAARTEADVTILEASGAAARVTVSALRPALVVASADLVLVYALAKGDKVDEVIRDATELGATRVVLARTARTVVKATAERAKDKVDRGRRVAEQAARQCGRADPPDIEGVLDWTPALEAAACEASFCLDPHASSALGPELAAAVGRGASVAFAIGPEGGLTPEEVEVARAAGFLPASLGRFVLRTETVAAAVLGAVRVLDAR